MASTKKKPKKPAWFVLSCATIELEEVVPKGASKRKPGATAGMPGDSAPPRQYKVSIRKPVNPPPGGVYSSDHVFDCGCADEPLLVDANRVRKGDLEELLVKAAENRERLDRARTMKNLAERATQFRILEGSPVAFYTQKVTFGPLVEKKVVVKKAKKKAKKPAKKRA